MAAPRSGGHAQPSATPGRNRVPLVGLPVHRSRDPAVLRPPDPVTSFAAAPPARGPKPVCRLAGNVRSRRRYGSLGRPLHRTEAQSRGHPGLRTNRAGLSDCPCKLFGAEALRSRPSQPPCSWATRLPPSRPYPAAEATGRIVGSCASPVVGDLSAPSVRRSRTEVLARRAGPGRNPGSLRGSAVPSGDAWSRCPRLQRAEARR